MTLAAGLSVLLLQYRLDKFYPTVCNINYAWVY